MTKYIFVTGGVVSSLGKGITAASLGRLLKSCGKKVLLQKFDPYINVDPGTMSPLQHGEVFVTDDGAETDLDVGHYERFVDVSLNKNSDITTGIVYTSVLEKERCGYYGGNTVQVIPHITNEIKERIQKNSNDDVDVVITEIGGTVGDIEGLPFLEAIRQLRFDLGRENVLYIHVTLVPYLSKSGELKTKPTQHSVKELRGIGISPDVIILRAEHELEDEQVDKIALFCNVEREAVIQNIDSSSIYEIPIKLDNQGITDLVMRKLNMSYENKDISEWTKILDNIKNMKGKKKIAMIVKYVDLKDAYISVYEAINHSAIANRLNIELEYIDAEKIDENNVEDILKDADGIIIPDGFGDRGFLGMVISSKYARKNNIPFLAIGMGMQAMVVDSLRSIGEKVIEDNIISNSKDDIIIAPRERENFDDRRLGAFDIKLSMKSKLYEIYKKENISERYRCKYELNNEFIENIKNSGLTISAKTSGDEYIEAVERKDLDFFIGVQFHPEFKSRPTNPHPLFSEFINELKRR